MCSCSHGQERGPGSPEELSFAAVVDRHSNRHSVMRLRHAALLATLIGAQGCEVWCKHDCAELNGNLETECGDCDDSVACRPGAPGFEVPGTSPKPQQVSTASPPMSPPLPLDLEVRSLHGGSVSLAQYAGNALLVVNTASGAALRMRRTRRSTSCSGATRRRGCRSWRFHQTTSIRSLAAPTRSPHSRRGRARSSSCLARCRWARRGAARGLTRCTRR